MPQTWDEFWDLVEKHPAAATAIVTLGLAVLGALGRFIWWLFKGRKKKDKSIIVIDDFKKEVELRIKSELRTEQLSVENSQLIKELEILRNQQIVNPEQERDNLMRIEALEKELQASYEIKTQNAAIKAELDELLALQIGNDTNKAAAKDFMDKGDYQAAIASLKEAAQGSIDNAADTFYEIGMMYMLQLNYSQALHYLELAVQIATENDTYLHEAATINYTLGNYDRMLELQQKALDIVIERDGEEHGFVATSYNQIGVAWEMKGDYDKALKYHEKAIEISERTYGKEHPTTAIIYNNLGIDWDLKKDHEKAIRYYEKALAIDKKNYGEVHPTIGNRYNNLGVSWRDQGDYNKSIDYLEKALDIGRFFYGEEHPEMATRYNNLGTTWQSKGDNEKAIQYYEKGVAISKNFYGEQHPNMATSYNNLGTALYAKGDYTHAIKCYEKSKIILQNFNMTKHPNYRALLNAIALANEALAKNKK